MGEESKPWPYWKIDAATHVVVSGDPDWGAVEVADSTPVFGNVTDTGDTSLRDFSVTLDKYATGSGSVTVYIRGSATPFGQFDEGGSRQRIIPGYGQINEGGSRQRIFPGYGQINEPSGPSWAEYTAPTTQTWRYVQVKMELA